MSKFDPEKTIEMAKVMVQNGLIAQDEVNRLIDEAMAELDAEARAIDRIKKGLPLDKTFLEELADV